MEEKKCQNCVYGDFHNGMHEDYIICENDESECFKEKMPINGSCDSFE